MDRFVRGAVARLVFCGVLAAVIVVSDQFTQPFYLNV